MTADRIAYAFLATCAALFLGGRWAMRAIDRGVTLPAKANR